MKSCGAIPRFSYSDPQRSILQRCLQVSLINCKERLWKFLSTIFRSTSLILVSHLNILTAVVARGPMVMALSIPQSAPHPLRASDPSEIQAEERLEIKNVVKTGHGYLPYSTTTLSDTRHFI